jgi:hypothetical protein
MERNVEAHSFNHCCSGKSISVIYSQCMFLALGIQDAIRVRHIVICVLSGTKIFFHIISWDFRKSLLNIQRVFWFSLQILSETFLILRTEPDKIRNVYWSTSKAPFFWSHFNETWIFSTAFLQMLKYQISQKSVYWKSSCSKRTDMTKLIDAFRNFAKALKNLWWTVHVAWMAHITNKFSYTANGETS